MRKIFFIISLLIAARTQLFAATDCSTHTLLQNAISTAGRNGTITCNSGSVTWTGTVSITYGITIHGSGLSITESGIIFNIAPDASAIANAEMVWIDNFTHDLNNAANESIHVTGAGPTSANPVRNLRITRNTFKNGQEASGSHSTGIIEVKGQVRGVISDNTFDRCSTIFREFGNDNTTEWSNGNFPFSFGTSDQLFFEHNTVTYSSTYNLNNTGWIENGQGGRSITRFNNYNMTNAGGSSELYDVHGFQNWNTPPGNIGQTGTMVTEYYHNTFTNVSDKYYWINHRGSWGMYFDNTMTGSSTPSIPINQTQGCGNGDISPNPTNYTPYVNNTYVFNNTENGTNTTMFINQNFCGSLVQENAQFWNYTASFNGTVGIGRGTKAALNAQSTCTTGVGFWVTDEGKWDYTSAASADGQFYKCTSTNTWTQYYIPYEYPHPLADLTTPTCGNSGNITFSSVANTSMTVNWGTGSDTEDASVQLLYDVYRSSTNNMGSVANAQANGTHVLTSSRNTTTFNQTGLSSGTTYWFQVLVHDQAGNYSACSQTSQATTGSGGGGGGGGNGHAGRGRTRRGSHG